MDMRSLAHLAESNRRIIRDAPLPEDANSIAAEHNVIVASGFAALVEAIEHLAAAVRETRNQ